VSRVLGKVHHSGFCCGQWWSVFLSLYLFFIVWGVGERERERERIGFLAQPTEKKN
jgi:hypothetical protein